MNDQELAEAVQETLEAALLRRATDVRVECTNPDRILEDRSIDMRVTVQPIDWEHAEKLLAEGFEWA